jgi:hypothetical protein
MKGLWFEADAGAGGGDKGGSDSKLTNFDAFIETQSDEIKTLYSLHTADLKSALEKEREAAKDAKKTAKRLAELEAKEKERADAEKSEMDKLTEAKATAEAERESARKELKAERIKNAIIAEASKLSFADPADAYTLIDLAVIEIDDQGKISGAAEAIKKLAEAKPYLLGKAKQGDGVGTPPKGPRKKEEPDAKRVPVIRSL